jgi:phasin family protein
MNTAKQNIEMYRDAADRAYASAVELGEIQIKGWKSLMEQQMGVFSLLMDAQLKQVELMSETKQYPEYVNAQVQLGKEVTEGLMGKGREALEMANGVRDEYRGWLEASMSAANEQLRQAAEIQS